MTNDKTNRILWPTHKAKAATRKALNTRIKRNKKRGNTK